MSIELSKQEQSNSLSAARTGRGALTILSLSLAVFSIFSVLFGPLLILLLFSPQADAAPFFFRKRSYRIDEKTVQEESEKLGKDLDSVGASRSGAGVADGADSTDGAEAGESWKSGESAKDSKDSRDSKDSKYSKDSRNSKSEGGAGSRVKGDGEDSGQAIDEALEDERNNSDLNKQIDKHVRLGDMFFHRRDYTNALIEYEEVLKLSPENFKAHFMLGKVLMSIADS